MLTTALPNTMDKILLFAGFLLIILGGIAMYTPWIQLRNSQRLTGKELSKQYPEHKWMRWGFVSLYLSWIVIVYFIFIKVLSSINTISFLAVFFASIGLFIGLFAVITGVSILPMRAPRIIFVVGEDAERAGRFQVAWSASVLMIAIAIEVIRRLT